MYTLFFTILKKNKKKGMIIIKFKSLDDVKKVYGEENLIKLCNIKQIVTYAKMNVQPKWITEGYDNKLIAYYFKPETEMAWKYWREKKMKKTKENS